MSQLDHHRTLERLDPLGLAQTAERLPEQLRYGWEQAAEVKLPATYAQNNQVVICGMGGSALGAELVLDLVQPRAKVPLTLCRSYTLPAYVGSNTLVIIISMSGTTEEMLAIQQEARRKKAKVIVVTGGGQLQERAKKYRQPCCHFESADYGDARYGTGIIVGILLRLLTKSGVCTIKTTEIEQALHASHEVIDTCAPDVPIAENPAKQIAEALHGQHVLVVAAEHLAGNAHTIANELNETAKQFTHSHTLPEFNHHFLEAFTHPAGAATQTTVLLLTSSLYAERLQQRCAITADLLEATGATVVEYETGGGTLLEEMIEVLTMGYYLSWYTAVLYGCETADLPLVTALKKALQKSSATK